MNLNNKWTIAYDTDTADTASINFI